MRYFAPVIFEWEGDQGFQYQVPTVNIMLSKAICVSDEHGDVLCKQKGWKEVSEEEFNKKDEDNASV